MGAAVIQFESQRLGLENDNDLILGFRVNLYRL
jgi:hypothetical protein